MSSYITHFKLHEAVFTIANLIQINVFLLPVYVLCFESEWTHFRRMPAQLRRTNSETVKMEMEQRKDAVLRTRNDEYLDLEVVEFEGKGRGVRARKRFVKKEPVVEYKGQIITIEEGEKREKKISPNFANLFYSQTFSKSKCSQSFCVDASTDTGRFGRLVNHSYKSPNCHIEVVDEFKGSPHLILVASRDIKVGEEITIDYCVTDREVLAANPWLRQS